MKTLAKNQSGVAHLLGLFVLALALVVGFAGYRVWQNQKTMAPVSGTGTADSIKRTTVPETVKNVSDLNQATTAVNSLPLDNDLNPSQMDSDISQLQ